MKPRLWQSLMTIAACMLVLQACDSVSPESEPVLVVEAFVETGKELPHVRLRQTLRVNEPYDESAAAAVGADVRLQLAGQTIPYEAVEGKPGLYRPLENLSPEPGADFTLEATWRDAVAEASGRLPRRIDILDVRTTIPDRPIEAVLLDSLQLDSLRTGATSGFVYPIEVDVSWESDNSIASRDTTSWIRAQLKPYTDLVPGVIELFFRSEQIVREDRIALEGGLRRWKGYYLVPVDDEDDPLPEHSLKVSLLRSDDDYARFASSRNAPERREPVSNVHGGIGIVAGISVDSLTLQVP